MKLYVTFTSPYASMVRIVILEKGLQGQVEIVQAQTRQTDTPY
jgi:glutathione S-transferase